MPENQTIIDSYQAFSKCLSEKEINNCVISLTYEDFINALSNKTEFEFTKCIICISYFDYCFFSPFKCALTFKECKFDSEFNLEILQLESNIIFEQCNFKYIRLSNLYSKKKNTTLSITSCSAESITVNFTNNINIKIHGDYKTINIGIVNSTIIIYNQRNNAIQFINYTLNNIIHNTYGAELITFTKCSFIFDFKIMDYDISSLKAINFNLCKFNKFIDFSHVSIDTIRIQDSIINDKLLIIDSLINNLELKNCLFHDTVKIIDLKGEIKKANFERSTIKGMFFFNGFKDDSLININNSSSVSFNHIFLEPTGYLIIRKIQNGNFIFDYANILGQIVMQELNINSLQMHNASIIGSLIMQDIKVKELDLKNTSLIGKLVFNPSDTLNIFDSNIIQNRETAYLLKKGKQEEGDSILASHFKRKELQLYLKDCTSNFKLNKGKECIVLFFNKISNDFGQSWVRGIIFTMSFAYIFYLLINFCGLEKPIFRFAWSLEGFGTAWKEYLKILNVLNFNDKLDNFKFTALGETLFFVSKIFVSYGIYQTVSAFRKFGK